jgi:hypothetical protein
MNVLKKITQAIKGLFTKPDVADKLVGGIQASLQYVPEILQVVAWIASMTPNRTDDEIVEAAKRLGLDAPVAGSPSEALAKLAVEWARRKWPNAPERRIRRALEIAYGAMKQ